MKKNKTGWPWKICAYTESLLTKTHPQTTESSLALVEVTQFRAKTCFSLSQTQKYSTFLHPLDFFYKQHEYHLMERISFLLRPKAHITPFPILLTASFLPSTRTNHLPLPHSASLSHLPHSPISFYGSVSPSHTPSFPPTHLAAFHLNFFSSKLHNHLPTSQVAPSYSLPPSSHLGRGCCSLLTSTPP